MTSCLFSQISEIVSASFWSHQMKLLLRKFTVYRLLLWRLTHPVSVKLRAWRIFILLLLLPAPLSRCAAPTLLSTRSREAGRGGRRASRAAGETSREEPTCSSEGFVSMEERLRGAETNPGSRLRPQPPLRLPATARASDCHVKPEGGCGQVEEQVKVRIWPAGSTCSGLRSAHSSPDDTWFHQQDK